MCIKQVTAWEHDGRYFATELEAVQAALRDLAGKLLREHSAHMADGLIEHSDKLMRLLERHRVLNSEAQQRASLKALTA